MRWNAESEWESQVFCPNPRGMVEARTRTHARRKNTLTKAKALSAASKIGGEWSDRNSDRKYPCVVSSESSDILLYLAGVNEHAVLRIVGSKRWSVAHLLRTIQYLFEYRVRFLAT